VTGLPWFQDEKDGATYSLLHLGAAASERAYSTLSSE